ncbi:hypothetical protein NEF87_000400 [Candidatus Lokiarchaeum ossiferum]|uniref:Uncharacterized protein n=1 Tax=Candidatus Lokiarchaeum ossiferum TaxID=2951803 RepID=A0ABY6HKS7_9ARCH|nr:hypothetical protein NEF87_000400 [Candidatus Lokiarchaeum sp. B-35]
MKRKPLELPKQIEKIPYYCSVCAMTHVVQIRKENLQGKHFPISYVYIHGNPQLATVLYIDKDLQVRGYENVKGIGINSDQLDEILHESRFNTLKRIPLSSILAFRLFQNEDIKKMYVKKGFENSINFDAISNLISDTQKITHNFEMCSDFYMKFNDYWIGALQLLDFRFIMIVSSDIDVDHLKFQIMNLFEIFSANYKTKDV